MCINNDKWIIGKYKKYKNNEIQSGYRCKTFLLNNKEKKIIYQVYLDNIKYQAEKKEYITTLIKDKINIKQIPNIIEKGKQENFEYLVTEFRDGIELEKIKKEQFDYKTFYKELAIILKKIHSVDIGDKFGWIGEKGLEEKDSFCQYIEDEIERNLNRISNFIDEKNLRKIEKRGKKALEEINKISKIKPVISWYDINSNNILVDNNSHILGFLDAGGARFAAKEWDLAFVKMDLCTNQKEFEIFLNEYSKDINIDNNLLNLLTTIVEIDDIAFQLETGVILPIAFESNMKDILTSIHENIRKNKYAM